MAKVLIIINGAGLLLNVLVFFLVVHYFSGAGGSSMAGIGAAGAGGAALSAADLDRELSKRFSRFDSTLAALSRKVDVLSSQIIRLNSASSSPLSIRPQKTRIDPTAAALERRIPGQPEPAEEQPVEEVPEQPAGGQVPDQGNQPPVEEPLPGNQEIPGQPQDGGR